MITAKVTNIRREQTRIIFFVSFSDGSERTFIQLSEGFTSDEIKEKAMQEIRIWKDMLNEAEQKRQELETFLDLEIN